ncbi:MAG: hypothetical protein LBI13_03270 [Streptococcaceae bacterium]|jgi:hypothetical protein|nr:hypothetical protein [Streptococcaceae bacterium]
MPKDISADKRYEMGLTISQKENDIDSLYQEKKNFEEQLQSFQATTHQNFQRSSLLYEKMARSGNRYSERELSVEYEMEININQTLTQQSEEFDKYYKETRGKLEADIEKLHKERNALPWD